MLLLLLTRISGSTVVVVVIWAEEASLVEIFLNSVMSCVILAVCRLKSISCSLFESMGLSLEAALEVVGMIMFLMLFTPIRLRRSDDAEL